MSVSDRADETGYGGDWIGGPDADLGDDLMAQIKPELAPGERLLWAARPLPEPPRWGGDWWSYGWLWAAGFTILGVGCFIAVVYPETHKSRFEEKVPAAIFAFLTGMVGLAIGCGTIAGARSRRNDRRRALDRVYALTDRRAILWEPVADSTATTIQVVPRGSLTSIGIRRTQFPDGSGDVTFGLDHKGPAGFLRVADVRRVEELVRRILVDPATRPDSTEVDYDLRPADRIGGMR